MSRFLKPNFFTIVIISQSSLACRLKKLFKIIVRWPRFNNFFEHKKLKLFESKFKITRRKDQ
jgi:hypothetical protein